jgi:hypothetical protein
MQTGCALPAMAFLVLVVIATFVVPAFSVWMQHW